MWQVFVCLLCCLRYPGPVRRRNESGRDVRLRMSGWEEREARSVALEKAYVHEVYDQISAESRHTHRGSAWPKVSQFLAELEPGSLVCDVGCGNGKYLNVNPSVFKIGADRCQSLVSAARKKDHEVLLCDNLRLPFRDESFDAVLSVAVVHHFATTERRVGAIRELARVLRIGGRLVITVWAMEQRHRKFESQDVLVPWHRQQQLGASLDFTSATTTASEEDAPGSCGVCANAGDSLPSTRLCVSQKKRGRSRHKSRYNDPNQPSSPGSSSLSSPNETCYSFVRRALQKLAGSTKSRARVRPWFLESWSSCAKEEPPQRHDPEGCEGAEDDGEDIQDLPIELRRLEEDHHDVAADDTAVTTTERRQTFTSAPRQDSILGHKSKSLTDILTTGQGTMVRSRSSVPSLGSLPVVCPAPAPPVASTSKPKLVKQKKSICEEEMEDEGRDEPTDMRDLVKALPEFRVASVTRRCGSVFKQSSMNEELMSTERLREKERVRQNIQKQASLNEELIFRRNRTLDSLRDTFFSTSTAKRFQILKNGFTNKLKSSTTGIEKVAGSSFKNGFVRILQGWKGGEAPPQPEASPGETAPPAPVPSPTTSDGRRTGSTSSNSGDDKKEGARRHSREDNSDSSKDSSLQSDTSVDSEDSFASVIFVPKQETQLNDPNAAAAAGPSSPVPTTSPKSPPFQTSPKSGQTPPVPTKTGYTPPVSPKTTQAAPAAPKSLTSPNAKPVTVTSPSAKSAPIASPGAIFTSLAPLNTKPTSATSPRVSPGTPTSPESHQDVSLNPHPHLTKQKSTTTTSSSLGNPLPSAPSPSSQQPDKEVVEKKTSPQQPTKLNQFHDLLSVKPAPVISRVAAAGVSSRSSLPLVRRSSAAVQGRADRPLPRLLSLELFNPETDDMDSDSSGVSSPDSVSSVISVLGDVHFQEERPQLVVDEAESNTPTEEVAAVISEREPQVSPSSLSLLEAAADVASSLEETVDAVIQSSPRARRKQLQQLESSDPMAVLQDGWSLHTSPVNPDGTHHQGGKSPGKRSGEDSWDEDCRQHLAEFAEKLSEKLLEEIDQYRQQTSQQQKTTRRLTALPEGFDHMNDPYLERLSEELNDLTRLSEELQERKSYIASLNSSQEMIPSFDKIQHESSEISSKSTISEYVSIEDKSSAAFTEAKAVEFCPKQMSADDLVKFSSGKDCDGATNQFSPREETITLLPRNIALKAEYSLESSDAGDASEMTGSGSDCSRRDNKTPSTTSLGPESSGSDCSKDLRFADRRTARCDGRSSSEEAPMSTTEHENFQKALGNTESHASLSGSTSQESLPSDSGGGAITFHRYYHVFREGELDQLIERYAENLHIISSYYDHANWCVVAEKVQVWTI